MAFGKNANLTGVTTLALSHRDKDGADGAPPRDPPLHCSDLTGQLYWCLPSCTASSKFERKAGCQISIVLLFGRFAGIACEGMWRRRPRSTQHLAGCSASPKDGRRVRKNKGRDEHSAKTSQMEIEGRCKITRKSYKSGELLNKEQQGKGKKHGQQSGPCGEIKRVRTNNAHSEVEHST